MNHRLPVRIIWLISAIGVICHGVSRAQPPAKPMKEIYQDFRGAKAMRADFRIGSAAPDVKELTKFEPGGLRVTLPATRPKHFPLEVIANFSLFGDFEITGAYELLSAAMPEEGYGVGVALIVADSKKLDKFIKVGRLMRPKEGSIYAVEYWTRYPPKDWQFHHQPTEVRSGQLRLVREGARLRCLVADEVGKDFSIVYEMPNFGAEEMAHVRFEVSDGNKPNNPVDARLLDWRIRMEAFPQTKPPGPNPLPPQPIPIDDPAPAPAQPARSGWLAALLVAGFGFTLLLAGAVALFVFLRQRRETRET